jgi:hypothetical protein
MITEKKKYYSLPKKTQPTSKSTKSNSTFTHYYLRDQNDTCPEVSDFNRHKYEIYTHTMTFDYGHL